MPDKDETGRSPQIIRNTDEEDAEIRRGIARDPDTPEWTAEEIRGAKAAPGKCELRGPAISPDSLTFELEPMPDKDETGRSPQIIRNTDEEDAEIRRGITRDPDNPEWTAEEIRGAKAARGKG